MLKRCKVCGVHYSPEGDFSPMTSVCVGEKRCPCSGSNSNCKRCEGLGTYEARFTHHTPEETDVRD
jgi:hypothetical protein